MGLADGEGADVVARPARVDGVELFERRGPEHVEDEGELVMVVAAGEEGSPVEHLGEDAADGPDVDGLRVLLETARYPHERAVRWKEASERTST